MRQERASQEERTADAKVQRQREHQELLKMPVNAAWLKHDDMRGKRLAAHRARAV